MDTYWETRAVKRKHPVASNEKTKAKDECENWKVFCFSADAISSSRFNPQLRMLESVSLWRDDLFPSNLNRFLEPFYSSAFSWVTTARSEISQHIQRTRKYNVAERRNSQSHSWCCWIGVYRKQSFDRGYYHSIKVMILYLIQYGVNKIHRTQPMKYLCMDNVHCQLTQAMHQGCSFFKKGFKHFYALIA